MSPPIPGGLEHERQRDLSEPEVDCGLHIRDAGVQRWDGVHVALALFGAIVTMRLLTGAAAAGLIPLTLAYIGDTVPYARRQATLGRLMARAGAAQVLSTSLGGSIATLISWRAVFPSLGGLAGVAALLLYVAGRAERQRPSVVGDRPSYAAVLRAPGMRPLLALVATEGFLFSPTACRRRSWATGAMGACSPARANQVTPSLLLQRFDAVHG